VALSSPRLTIGEFARRTRLTVDALRHYDKLGLLRPAEVDPRTGYRYYDADQVEVALQLALFRRIDVPLDQLLSWVAGSIGLEEMLDRQRARLVDEQRARREMIAMIDAIAEQGSLVSCPVEHVDEPARHGVALSFDAAWSRIESATRHGLARLAVVLAPRSTPTTASSGALFPIDPGARVRVTVFVLRDGDEESVAAPLAPLSLPGGAALVTEHRGDHRLLGYAYRALLARAAALGHDVIGPAREHYRFEPDGTPSTRLVVPVCDRSVARPGE
jgi:DNA-binding transcriptional MerR regulator